MNQAPMINNAYSTYQQQLAPYTNPAYLNPMGTPGFGNALAATNADITNQVNSSFAKAGRDMSGMNQQDLARGLSQGKGQLISNQYNQNVAAQQNAMNALYGAGNTTASNLTGLQQTGLGNQQAGINASNAATAAQQYGPNLQLQAGLYGTQIPLQTLQAQSGSLPPLRKLWNPDWHRNGNANVYWHIHWKHVRHIERDFRRSNDGPDPNNSPLWQQLAGGILGTGSMLGGNTGLLKALGLG